MTGWAAAGRRGLVASALAKVEEFLLEPTEATAREPAATPAVPPVVAVVPLAPRSGGTTVARGLAATFAAQSTLGATIVCGPTGSVALSLSTPGATRLGRSVGDWTDAACRVSGRLCLVDSDARIARAAALRSQCPLVVDLPHGADASEGAAVADVVVLVAGPETEPALAAVVGAALVRSGPGPLIVLSRPLEDSPMAGSAHFELPDARLASRVALAGREPPGALGQAVASLAARCVEVAP